MPFEIRNHIKHEIKRALRIEEKILDWKRINLHVYWVEGNFKITKAIDSHALRNYIERLVQIGGGGYVI